MDDKTLLRLVIHSALVGYILYSRFATRVNLRTSTHDVNLRTTHDNNHSILHECKMLAIAKDRMVS